MGRTKHTAFVDNPSTLTIETCAWRTGASRCGIHVYTQLRCQWHQHWFMIIDGGYPGLEQHDAFAEWWEQFQPYGQYGDNPGPWWASKEMLWRVLSGQEEQPVLTSAIENELILRRADVRRYRYGMNQSSDPWPRLTDIRLPPWDAIQWQQTMNAMRGI